VAVYQVHVILYRVEDDRVHILRIVDARRDWVRLLAP
jgi:plasmid stabilization system protein ParE